MLLKKTDDKSAVVAELEALARTAGQEKRRAIDDELRMMRAGIKGERDAAYLIDFDYAKSDDMAVIHDLRLEIDGRVAQIDHLLIHRSLHCFVLETKQFHAGIKITDSGEFLRWNERKRNYDGMASPLAQNERHISVLRDAFGRLLLPQRAGVPLTPVFHSFVVVPSAARIDRPAHFDTSRVVKMDLLRNAIEKDLGRAGVPVSATESGTGVSSGTLANVARQLVALHRRTSFNYQRKFGFGGNGPDKSAESSESGGEQQQPFLKFPPGWPEKQWRTQERRPPAWGGKLGYATVLLVAVVVMNAGFRKEPTTVNLGRPPAPAATRVPESVAPVVRLNDRSLTVTGKGGTPIAEMHGNLPKIREEMRQSRLGAKRTYAEGEAATEPAARCDPKPVMTDEDIAACRRAAGRR